MIEQLFGEAVIDALIDEPGRQKGGSVVCVVWGKGRGRDIKNKTIGNECADHCIFLPFSLFLSFTYLFLSLSVSLSVSVYLPLSFFLTVSHSLHPSI